METTGEKVLRKLESLGFKPDGRTTSGETKYRGNSPLRAGSNSNAFVVMLSTDGEHGGYQDHAREEDKGSLYDLAKLLDIELPELEDRKPAAATKRPYRNLVEYAQDHGVQPEVFMKAGWKEVIYQQRIALSFPTHSGIYYRFIDGEKPTFKPEKKGYRSCWFGLNANTAELLRNGHPLVIANGPPSVVVGQHYGVAAACITMGEKGFPQELIDELRAWLGPEFASEIEVLIALDCDPKGIKTARTVLAQLTDVGFRTRAIDLGFTMGGDLADFCQLYKYDAPTQITTLPNLDNAPFINMPSENLGWYLIKLRDLDKLPPLRFLLDGYLVANGINMLIGDSGIGKSFWSIDQAMRLAKTDPVCYVVGEGKEGYRLRTNAWLKYHNPPPHEIEAIQENLNLSIGAPKLLEKNHRDQFISMMRPLNPILIVVDTLATSMTGDENNAKEVGDYLRACLEINSELMSAILLVHHVGKDGNIRGSTQWRGWAAQVVKMSDDDGYITLESDKIKDGEQVAPLTLKLLKVPLGEDIDGKPVSSAVILPEQKVVQRFGDPLTKHQGRILQALSLEVYEEGASPSEIAEIVECKVGSVVKVLSKLLGLGYAKKGEGYRPPYSITADGHVALASWKGSNGIQNPPNGI